MGCKWKKIVYGEGSTKKWIFQKCLAIFYATDLLMNNIYNIWWYNILLMNNVYNIW